MLFHIKMTHTIENCPVYLSPSEQEKFFADAEKMQSAANEMNIKVHFMVAGVGHTMYALVEADNFNALNIFFSGMPLKQDYQIEPVGHIQDAMAAFKAEMAKK